MRHAVILNGQVVNVVLWDGVSDWSPGEIYAALECPDHVGIGWLWNADDGFYQVAVEDPA